MTPRPVRTRIFVVSMANASERRRAFAADAAGAEAPWRFFDAWDRLHPDLEYDEDAAIVAKGRPLRQGEIGCYSSHFALWLQLLADPDADQYIVLEDDVIVDWDYVARFAAVDHGAAGHDYVRLYYKKPAPSRIIAKDYVCRATWLTEVAGYCFGTQGYMITRAAAERLAAHCRELRRPIDDEMDRSWVHGVRNLAVFPFPLMERKVESGIGLQRFERYPVPRRLKLQRLVAHTRERAGYQLFGRRRFRFQR